MAKKDFSKVKTDPLYNTIAEATAELEPAELEPAEIAPAEIEPADLAPETQAAQPAQGNFAESIEDEKTAAQEIRELYENLTVKDLLEITADSRPFKKNRREYTREEAEKAMVELKTSGRKGVKLPRYNVAFAPDLYAYIQTMSRAAGQSYTEFINLCVRQHLNANKEKYDTARSFLDSLQ